MVLPPQRLGVSPCGAFTPRLEKSKDGLHCHGFTLGQSARQEKQCAFKPDATNQINVTSIRNQVVETTKAKAPRVAAVGFYVEESGVALRERRAGNRG